MFTNFDNVDGNYVYTIYRTADGVKDTISYKELVKPFQDQMHAVQLANAKYRDMYLELNEEHETLKAILKKMVQAEKVLEDKDEKKEKLNEMIQEKVGEMLEEPKKLLVEAMEQMKIMIKEKKEINASLAKQNEEVKDSICNKIQNLINQKKAEENNYEGSSDSDSDESVATLPIETHYCGAEDHVDEDVSLVGAEEREKVVLEKVPQPSVSLLNSETQEEFKKEIDERDRKIEDLEKDLQEAITQNELLHHRYELLQEAFRRTYRYARHSYQLRQNAKHKPPPTGPAMPSPQPPTVPIPLPMNPNHFYSLSVNTSDPVPKPLAAYQLRVPRVNMAPFPPNSVPSSSMPVYNPMFQHYRPPVPPMSQGYPYPPFPNSYRYTGPCGPAAHDQANSSHM